MATAQWVVQLLLGLLFIVTGSFKFFQSRQKVIASGGTWAEDFSPAVIKAIAGVELICGMLLTPLSFIGPGHSLTLVAAVCIAVIMLGAIAVHIRRKEWPHAAINLVFLLMALFVAYGARPV